MSGKGLATLFVAAFIVFVAVFAFRGSGGGGSGSQGASGQTNPNQGGTGSGSSGQSNPPLTDCGGGVHVDAGRNCPNTDSGQGGSGSGTSNNPPQRQVINNTDNTGGSSGGDGSGGGSVSNNDNVSGSYDSTARHVSKSFTINLSLGSNESLIDQSYGFQDTTGGCQVFAVTGPYNGSVTVVDGEWTTYHGVDRSSVQTLINQNMNKQRTDYNCSSSNVTRLG